MSYTSLYFLLPCVGAVLLYYLIPRKLRYLVLLACSVLFYVYSAGRRMELVLFASSILVSYLAGLVMDIMGRKDEGGRASSGALRRLVLIAGIVLGALPLLLSKAGALLAFTGSSLSRTNWILPLGLSFYTLQIIAYMADVYQKKVSACRNFLKYALFISFFPQIIQGPIPRYAQLYPQLSEGNDFDGRKIIKSFYLILWAFFLKMMIADRAGIAVDMLFDHERRYAGFYILLAGVLYGIQLYTDFLAAVTISRGIAGLFGITLENNFNHPYLAVSIRDFWHRWHMSLSSWLRDYIYIPLGGSRKGKIRRDINLVITFLVSGLWHGGGFRFIFWGLLHAFYQIAGRVTENTRKKLYSLAGIAEGSFAWKLYKRIFTFILVMLGWIIFRAGSLRFGLRMIRNMFSVFNPWIFFNGALYRLGLSLTDWAWLLISLVILLAVSLLQEKMCIRDWILKQHFTIRWGLCIGVILVVWIYGIYGAGFNAQAFIYGGF